MIDGDFVLVDSNIIVYAYDKDDLVKHAKAKEIMNLAWDKKKTLVFSIQNISEFFSVITTKIKNPVEINIVFNIIKDISNFPNFIIFTFTIDDVLKAINFVDKFKINYWDALIASVMQKNNIDTIITEDEDAFKKIPWLEIINPFKEEKESESENNKLV